MDNSGNNKWKDSYEVYTEGQVEGVILECGIDLESETATHFVCMCPFHDNTDSPAFVVDKVRGLFTCFNPSCGVSGPLSQLPIRLLGKNIFEAKRIILKHREQIRLRPKTLEATEFPVFSQEIIDRMHSDFWSSAAHEYMLSRGFTDETLEFFQVGFSERKGLVVVPMYGPSGPVGVIGRTLPPEKRFRNSDNLPKKEIPWNFYNARHHGETVIICESSFDAMRIHQAGYPGVVAILGGHITSFHVDLLNKTFSRIIIMTDFDNKQAYQRCAVCRRAGYVRCRSHRPGRDLGRQIIEKMEGRRISWAIYDETCVFPHNAKDASDMTDDEIRQCIRNSVSNFQYLRLKLEDAVP